MISPSVVRLGLSLIVASTTAWAAPNPVDNGGFENGDATWSLEAAADFASVEVVKDPFAPDGDRVLMFDHRRTRTSHAVHEGFRLEPYSFYHLTFWMKADHDYTRVGPGLQVNLSVEGGGTNTRFQEAALSPETWKLQKLGFVTAASADASLNFALNSSAGKVWIDNVRVSPGNHTRYPKIPLKLGEATSDVFYDEIPVSSNIPSRIVFRVRPNLPDGLWESSGRFLIDLPTEISVQEPHDGTSEDLKNGFTRYAFAADHFWSKRNWFGCLVFILCDEPEIGGRHATCWVEWEGGKETPNKIPIKYLEIPSVAQPKEILTGVAAAGNMTEIYPNYFGMLRSLGFNTVDFWKRGQGAEHIENFVAHGIDVDAEHSGFSDLRGMVGNVEGMGSITMHGKPSGAIDASHRGEGFQKMLSELDDLVAKGFSCIMIDDEHHGDHTMNTCVCERCKGRWSEWLGNQRPHLDPVAPEIFLDDPFGYGDHFDAWWFFRANLVTEWYEAAREQFYSSVEKRGSHSSRKPWFGTYTGAVGMSNIKDNFVNVAETGGVFDRIMPMYYSGGYHLRVEIRKLIRAAGREYSYASLNMGEARADRRMWKPGENRAHILETLFAGGRGYMYWAWNKSNLRIIAEVAETNGIVAEYEDLFLNGKNTERFWTEQPRTFATTLETGDEGMLLVSNYTGTDNTRVRVFKRPEKAMTLTEVYTNQKLKLAPQQQIFAVSLPSAQCSLWKWKK